MCAWSPWSEKLRNQPSATKGFGHVKKTECVQYSIYLSRDVVKAPPGTFHTCKISS